MMLCLKAYFAMRRPSSYTVIVLVCLLSIPALSQDEVVRIGVPLLRSWIKNISQIAARDRLVRALSQHKPDKKLRIAVQAIPLESEWGTKAFLEAREKTASSPFQFM